MHVDPYLGDVRLRDLSAEAIAHWQAQLLAAGRSADTVRRASTLLGAILQRAVEGRRILQNPQRLVRTVPAAMRSEVRPFAPSTIELLRRTVLTLAHKGRSADVVLRRRDAVLISLLAYAGLRPVEARGLEWGHVGENTLVVDATKTGRRRSVRLLGPLRQDLAEWRLAQGRPPAGAPVIPGADGRAWGEVAYEQWRGGIWRQTLEAAQVDYQRPYDLRHSFASLLLHEGRSVIYVARQLGHGAGLTMSTYGHVVEELEEAPMIPAETAIRQARENLARPMSTPQRG